MTTCKCIDVEELASSCRQWSMDPVLVSAGLPRFSMHASFANGPNLGYFSICEVCIPRVFAMPLDEGRRHMSTYLMNVCEVISYKPSSLPDPLIAIWTDQMEHRCIPHSGPGHRTFVV